MKEIDRPNRSNVYGREIYTREEITRYKLTMEELETPGELPDITIYSVALYVLKNVTKSAAFRKVFKGGIFSDKTGLIDKDDIYFTCLYISRNLQYDKSYNRGKIIRFFKISVKYHLIEYLLKTYRPDIKLDNHKGSWQRVKNIYTSLDFTAPDGGLSQGEKVCGAVAFNDYELERRSQEETDFFRACPHMWQEFKTLALKLHNSRYTVEIIDAIEHGERMSAIAKRHNVSTSYVSQVFCLITDKVAPILRERYPGFIQGESRRGIAKPTITRQTNLTIREKHAQAVLVIARKVYGVDSCGSDLLTQGIRSKTVNLKRLVAAGYVLKDNVPMKVAGGFRVFYRWNKSRTLEQLEQDLKQGKI